MPLQAYPSYDDIILNNEKDFTKEGPNPEIDDICFLDDVCHLFYPKVFDYPVSLKWKLYEIWALLEL